MPQLPNVDDSRGGYPALAWLMSAYPEYAIFRRFKELNALNLLRLQAEIQLLEHQLDRTRLEDFVSNDNSRDGLAKDFRAMSDADETGESLQWEELTTIGKKLAEYNSALSLMSNLSIAAQPGSRDLKSLKEWLSRPNGGNGFLVDQEALVWADEDTAEYTSLYHSNMEGDAFTTLLTGRLLDLHHYIWSDREDKKLDSRAFATEIRRYSPERINRLNSIIGAALSSLLPTLVILVLYFVKRMLVRIGLVIVFTTMFSTALAIFTSARKVEIFSATAAFAAVEVVFIGSTDTKE